MSSRSRLIPVVGCLLSLTLLSACAAGDPSTSSRPPGSGPPGSEAPEGPPQSGGQLVVAVAAETESFNPYGGAWSTSTFPIANALYDPLVALDTDGRPHPYLAASITSTPDFKTWTIGVRPDVTFHDGSPVDAAAIKRNLDTAKTTGLTAQAYASVDTVTAPDAATVVVSLKRAWSSFPVALSSQAGYVVAPSMLDDPAGSAAKVVGSGPFTFQERQRDAFLKATRNAHYWQKDAQGTPLPYLDGIDFEVITDPSTRGSSFQAGDVDAVQVATASEMRSAQDLADRQEAELLTDSGQETNEFVLAFNTSKEPFDDPTARQAVAAALDQDLLAETAYQGAFPAAWGMFDEGSPWYISRDDAHYPAHDLDRAKALAAEYEQRHGRPLRFSSLSVADADNLGAAQAVQAQLAEAGITLEVESMELAALISRVIVSGDYQASTFQMWSAPGPDQGYIFLATPANPTGLSLNYTRFDNPAVVTALDEYRATTDEGEQKDAIARVQRELATNLPVVFLYRARTAFLSSPRVHGLTAATFPGTTTRAVASYTTAPFLATAWLAH